MWRPGLRIRSKRAAVRRTPQLERRGPGRLLDAADLDSTKERTGHRPLEATVRRRGWRRAQLESASGWTRPNAAMGPALARAANRALAPNAAMVPALARAVNRALAPNAAMGWHL